MIGKELKEVGMLVEAEDLKLVKKALPKGGEIPKHNHAGSDIYFTVVKGQIDVTLNDEEKYSMIPGSVLNFCGDNYISGVAKEESEVFIYLFERK